MKHQIKFKRVQAGSYEVLSNGQLVANIYGPDRETKFWHCYPADCDLAVDLQFSVDTYRQARFEILHTAEHHDGETFWHIGSEWKA